MNREIKRPDVSVRNRLLKTKVFETKLCNFCDKEIPVKVFRSRRYLNGRFCTRVCYGLSKIGNIGELSTNWKGGKTTESKIIRSSREYKEWRASVFKRDNYTCVICGDSKGGNLQADHIKPFAYFPELRLEITNGRTLCKTCHMNTETWGNNKNIHEHNDLLA